MEQFSEDDFLNLTNIQKLRLSEWNAISIYQTRWLITTSTTSWAIYYQKKWQQYKKYFGRLLHPKVTKRFRDNQKFNIEYAIANFETKLQGYQRNPSTLPEYMTMEHYLNIHDKNIQDYSEIFEEKFHLKTVDPEVKDLKNYALPWDKPLYQDEANLYELLMHIGSRLVFLSYQTNLNIKDPYSLYWQQEQETDSPEKACPQPAHKKATDPKNLNPSTIQSKTEQPTNPQKHNLPKEEKSKTEVVTIRLSPSPTREDLEQVITILKNDQAFQQQVEQYRRGALMPARFAALYIIKLHDIVDEQYNNRHLIMTLQTRLNLFSSNGISNYLGNKNEWLETARMLI